MNTDNEIALRDKAREAIQAGQLPNRRADRMWGGPGGGADCVICCVPVKQDEVEIEVEFAQGDGVGRDRYRVHVRCFAAWEFEVDQLQSSAPAAVSRTPPTSSLEAVGPTLGALPGKANGRKITGRGSTKTYRRGPA